MDEQTLKKMLRVPDADEILDMVIDTDTYNEIDDQFALCYSLLSPERLNVRAVYAAPFFNEKSSSFGDGMEKSYEEILRLFARMGKSPDNFVFKGADRTMPDASTPVLSDAVRDLIQKAKEYSSEHPLYVVAIGAITNIASALLADPSIADKIVIVWLGGHALSWEHMREFNLMGDLFAVRAVFDSKAPVVVMPCMGVASHMLSTVSEMNFFLKGKNALCDFLCARVEEFEEQYGAGRLGFAKEIWDVAAVAYLQNPDYTTSVLAPSPIITDDYQCLLEESRHPIRVVLTINRNDIFDDLFKKLQKA